jgi:hypothetical protein
VAESFESLCQHGSEYALHGFSELFAGRGKVKDVNRHLAFGIDERNLDIAAAFCEAFGDFPQQPSSILRDYLQQAAVR